MFTDLRTRIAACGFTFGGGGGVPIFPEAPMYFDVRTGFGWV